MGGGEKSWIVLFLKNNPFASSTVHFFFFKVSSCHPLRVAQKVGGKVVFDELGPRNTPQRPQMVLTSELLIRLGSWDICGGIPSCFVSAETLKMCKMLGNRATNRISRSAYRSDV